MHEVIEKIASTRWLFSLMESPRSGRPGWRANKNNSGVAKSDSQQSKFNTWGSAVYGLKLDIIALGGWDSGSINLQRRTQVMSSHSPRWGYFVAAQNPHTMQHDWQLLPESSPWLCRKGCSCWDGEPVAVGDGDLPTASLWTTQSILIPASGVPPVLCLKFGK